MGKKGEAKTGGRKAGTPNKVTSAVKDMIVLALDRVGGVEYLVRQAEDEPKAFMHLVGKVLPLQVTGADGQSFKLSIAIEEGRKRAGRNG
jgi:hypothetical protein